MPDQNSTITSANSVVTFTVPGLFPAPVQLQGYSADRAWATDNVELAEVQRSVDGRQTAGYIFNSVRQTFSLQADSPSKSVFLAIQNAMKAAREIFYIQGTIDLPSTGESFVCRRGVLQAVKALPDAARVLQSMDFMVVWESIDPSVS